MKPIALACLFCLAAAPALADVSLSVGVTLSGDAEIRNTAYDCGDAGKLAVQYVNAAPNFLAVIPIKEQTLVFVNTISASGAKYESGQDVWWNKGADATLSDVTEGLDAARMLPCTGEHNSP
jgi:membrane-bound inhibitor of C-type lysozyme